jgi:hypothetical protein
VNQRAVATGGVIFISNLELNSTPMVQALKSRAHYPEYSPTDEQITLAARPAAT